MSQTEEVNINPYSSIHPIIYGGLTRHLRELQKVYKWGRRVATSASVRHKVRGEMGNANIRQAQSILDSIGVTTILGITSGR